VEINKTNNLKKKQLQELDQKRSVIFIDIIHYCVSKTTYSLNKTTSKIRPKEIGHFY
jgi:hypothetical protein